MWIYGILIMGLFHGILANKTSARTEAAIGEKDDPNATTESDNRDSAGQFINNLTITDVRNILEILLLTFKKQPSIPTLKLLDLLINNLIQQNTATKQLHRSLLHELKHYQELQTILGDIDPDVTIEKPVENVTRVEQLLLSTVYNTTSAMKNMSQPNVVTENLSVINNSLESNSTTTVSIVTEEEEEEEVASTTVLDKLPVNSSYEETTETINFRNFTQLVQEISPSVTETTKSFTEKVYRPNNTNFTEDIGNIINLYPDYPTVNVDTARKNIAIDSAESSQEVEFENEGNGPMFPKLDISVLNTLSRFNIKLVRTYTETFEPLTYKAAHKNRKYETTGYNFTSQNDEQSESVSSHESTNYHTNHKINSRRKSRSANNDLQNNFYPTLQLTNLLNLKEEDLSDLWKKVFGYDLLLLDSQPISSEKYQSIHDQNYAKYIIGDSEQHQSASKNKNSNLKQNNIKVSSTVNRPMKTTCSAHLVKLSTVTKNKQSTVSYRMRNRNTTQSQSSSVTYNSKSRPTSAPISKSNEFSQQSKSLDWTKAQSRTSYMPHVSTTRKPLRPPGKTTEISVSAPWKKKFQKE